jgi:hypothetical protein
LVEKTPKQGLELVGEGGLLQRLTKQISEGRQCFEGGGVCPVTCGVSGRTHFAPMWRV